MTPSELSSSIGAGADKQKLGRFYPSTLLEALTLLSMHLAFARMKTLSWFFKRLLGYVNLMGASSYWSMVELTLVSSMIGSTLIWTGAPCITLKNRNNMSITGNIAFYVVT